jgi:hypothetical protein
VSDTPEHRPGLREEIRAEVRDAVTPRAFGLVAAVLLLQLGFILSYVGAFHHPTPHRMRLAVVAPAGAPAGAAQQVVGRLNAIAGEPVHATTAQDEAAARDRITHRKLDGALLLGTGSSDRLLVAGAEGGAVAQAMEQVVTGADTAQQRTVQVSDIVPAESGDARGLSSFYIAVGWVVGGYLVASILAISAGELPATRRRARIRIFALGAYAVLSGIGGALVAGPLLGALTGRFWMVSWFGALLVFAVGAFTMAIEALAGIAGIGLAVLLFVVLGNPSAGGPYPGPLLPPFWRAIGPWLPPGAGTSGLRGIVYFDNAGLAQAALVVAAYAVVGSVALLLVTMRRTER